MSGFPNYRVFNLTLPHNSSSWACYRAAVWVRVGPSMQETLRSILHITKEEKKLGVGDPGLLSQHLRGREAGGSLSAEASLVYRVSSRTARATHRNPISKTKQNKTTKRKAKRGREGWRDGSVGKSTDCCSEGPEFKSQQPHGGSQPSIMRPDAFFWCI